MSKLAMNSLKTTISEKGRVSAALLARAFNLDPKPARAKLRKAAPRGMPRVRNFSDARKVAKLMGAGTRH